MHIRFGKSKSWSSSDKTNEGEEWYDTTECSIIIVVGYAKVSIDLLLAFIVGT